jgi:hypothetical protein
MAPATDRKRDGNSHSASTAISTTRCIDGEANVLSRNARLILQRADEFFAGTRRPSPAAVEFARRLFALADAARDADRQLADIARTAARDVRDGRRLRR